MRSLLLAALVALVPVAASAQDWNRFMDVEATATPGDPGQIRVVFEGHDGWYVNTAYPGIKVTLTAPDGVTLPKPEAGKADVEYQEPHPGGKAKRAVFELPVSGQAEGAVAGSYKIVICSADTCSPPFKGSFEAPFVEPES